MQKSNAENYLPLNCKFLELSGLYPVNLKRYSLCVCFMSLIILPQIVQIYKNSSDLEVVLETSSVLFTLILATLKSMIWIYYRENVKFLIRFLINDYWNLASAFQAPCFLKYAGYGKKLTRSYLFLIINALAFFYSLPEIEIIVNRLRGTYSKNSEHFPFLATYPQVVYESPILFQLTYLSQMMATSTCALIILATDTTIAMAIFLTSGHFSILQDSLRQLNAQIELVSKGSKTNSVETQKSEILLERYVIRLVKHHQVIIRFSRNMQHIFSPMLFLQVLASSLIVCLVALQVNTTLEDGGGSKLFEYVAYLFMALFQLLLFCWPGDIMIAESSLVGEAAYAVKWHNMSASFKNVIFFIILRSQKAINITAGKVYVMHLQNFSTILNTSVSFFMVLRSFHEDGAS